jgi:hypothetical protein
MLGMVYKKNLKWFNTTHNKTSCQIKWKLLGIELFNKFVLHVIVKN